jgi:hypothetical protein
MAQKVKKPDLTGLSITSGDRALLASYNFTSKDSSQLLQQLTRKSITFHSLYVADGTLFS